MATTDSALSMKSFCPVPAPTSDAPAILITGRPGTGFVRDQLVHAVLEANARNHQSLTDGK